MSSLSGGLVPLGGKQTGREGKSSLSGGLVPIGKQGSARSLDSRGRQAQEASDGEASWDGGGSPRRARAFGADSDDEEAFAKHEGPTEGNDLLEDDWDDDFDDGFDDGGTAGGQQEAQMRRKPAVAGLGGLDDESEAEESKGSGGFDAAADMLDTTFSTRQHMQEASKQKLAELDDLFKDDEDFLATRRPESQKPRSPRRSPDEEDRKQEAEDGDEDEESWGDMLPLDSLIPDNSSALGEHKLGESEKNSPKSLAPAQADARKDEEESKGNGEPSHGNDDSIGKTGETKGSDGYEFSFGRIGGTSSRGPRQRRSLGPPAKPTRKVVFSDSSDDDDEPLFKNSRLPSFLRKGKGSAATGGESSEEAEIKGSSIPSGPATPATPATPEPSTRRGEAGTVKETPEWLASAQPESSEASTARGRRQQATASPPPPDKEMAPAHAPRSPPPAPQHEDTAPAQRVPSYTINLDKSPVPEGPAPTRPAEPIERAQAPAVAVDLSEMREALRTEYQALVTEAKAEWSRKNQAAESALEAAKSETQAVRAELEERIKSLESQLGDARGEKAHLELKLQHMQVLHDDAMATMKATHEQALKESSAGRETSKTLAALAEKLDASAKSVQQLELEMQTRHDASEKARLSQLECRERLVGEMEAQARMQLEHASEESRKLQALHASFESSQVLSRKRVDEDRIRLKEEHARLEALHLTLKTEAETLRTEAIAARGRLREERMQWEAERREWQLRVQQQESRLEGEKRALEKQRQSLDSERRMALQDLEAGQERLRAEEQELREGREAQARTRATLKEEAEALARSRSELAEEQEACEKALGKLADEKAKHEAALAELRNAARDKKEAARLCRETHDMRKDLRADQTSVERARAELCEGQRQYHEMRLRVAKEQAELYKHRAEAREAADAARALQRKAAMELTSGGAAYMLHHGNENQRQQPRGDAWLADMVDASKGLARSYSGARRF